MIDVVDKKIESVNALLEASFDPVPFGRFDDAWNNVKRKDFFRGRAVAVNVKGDSLIEEGKIRSLLAPPEFVGWNREQPAVQLSVVRAWIA